MLDCWSRARVASAAPLSIMRTDNSDSLVCGGALGVSIAIMWSVLFINKCHKRDTGSQARPSQLHYNYNIERWRENTPAALSTTVKYISEKLFQESNNCAQDVLGCWSGTVRRTGQCKYY